MNYFYYLCIIKTVSIPNSSFLIPHLYYVLSLPSISITLQVVSRSQPTAQPLSHYIQPIFFCLNHSYLANTFWNGG